MPDLQTLLTQARTTHCFQHHGAQVGCYLDCATCLALQRLAMALKAAGPPAPAPVPASAPRRARRTR